jgi:hypothetical protein
MASAPAVEVPEPEQESLSPAAVQEEVVREETVQPEVIVSASRGDSREEPVILPVPLQLDWSTDLIQVETNPEKHRIALSKELDEQPVPRAKRVRPPLPPINEVPLIQVETRSSGATASPPPA